MTSVKIVETCFAISRVTIRFAAITPPNADISSHMCAFAWASAIGSDEVELPTAIPHGLACLITATAGSLKS